MVKRRIFFNNIFFRHTLVQQESAKNLIRSTRENIVRTQQIKLLITAPFFTHQIFSSGNQLLVGRSTGINDIARTLLPFVLNRIKEQTIALFKNRQNRLARNRSPATKSHSDIFFPKQHFGFLGKQIPIRCRIDNHGFNLLTQHAATGIDLSNSHKHDIAQ